MRDQRVVSALVLFLLGFGALACQVQPVPMSAQAGSTVMLPISVLGGGGPIGHGGTDYSDPQRGELVFALGDTIENGGTELRTRFTAAVSAGPRSPIEYSQYVAFVDLVNPQGAVLPEGPQTIHISHRLNGQVTSFSPAQSWTVAILPATVTAGGQPVTGAATPLQAWDFIYGGGWTDIPLQGAEGEIAFEDAIPKPAIRLGVRRPNGQPYETSSLVVDVSFPDDRIDVVGATTLAGRTAWYEDRGLVGNTRTLRVSGAATGEPLALMDLVFELKGTTPLLDTDIIATVVKAVDPSFVPIADDTAFVSLH